MIAITKMELAHVPQIAALEKACFSDPWRESSIASEVENPLALWLVALEEDRVVGYIGSQTVLGETDLLNLAVAPDFRRRHIGEELLLTLIARLGEGGSRSMTLEVRPSNFQARKLYEKLGFAQVGLRRNYYEKPREDGLILRKEWEK